MEIVSSSHIDFILQIKIDVNKNPGRLSTASSRSTGSRAIEDEHYQDWSTVTAEKDSWANRERRRSSLFHKIDSYPGPSTLSLWSGGKDKKGKDVLYSGDGDVDTWDEDGEPLAKTISGRTRRVGSLR